VSCARGRLRYRSRCGVVAPPAFQHFAQHVVGEAVQPRPWGRPITIRSSRGTRPAPAAPALENSCLETPVCALRASSRTPPTVAEYWTPSASAGWSSSRRPPPARALLRSHQPVDGQRREGGFADPPCPRMRVSGPSVQPPPRPSADPAHLPQGETRAPARTGATRCRRKGVIIACFTIRPRSRLVTAASRSTREWNFPTTTPVRGLILALVARCPTPSALPPAGAASPPRIQRDGLAVVEGVEVHDITPRPSDDHSVLPQQWTPASAPSGVNRLATSPIFAKRRPRVTPRR